MNEPLSDYVDLVAFSGLWEAEALKLALDRQWLDPRIVVERPWWPALLGATDRKLVHVQVPGDCYEEACRYLEPGQLKSPAAVPSHTNH